MPERKLIRVVFVGNPNCGKSTLFNEMTGARQHIGNYPGVTVEKMEGSCFFDDYELRITDLPGTYSLSAFSEDERVACDFLKSSMESLDPTPLVVVNILDASNLERNLYLTIQLREMGTPMLAVFNMADLARKKGMVWDLPQMEDTLQFPIVETVGTRAAGLDELKKRILFMAENPPEVKKLVLSQPDEKVSDVEAATRRYKYIDDLCTHCVRTSIPVGRSLTDRLDAWFLNRYLGIPLFLLMMYLVFQLTFTFGALPMEWLDTGFGMLGDWISSFWPEGSESLLQSLLVDGIIGGVGGVIVFLPNILLLFLAISLLEDSGYMARAAFLMDRFMRKIGLHGKSFIPMLIGFGCSVPGIMATRTLENRRERLATMFVLPLMSCGARLPIYALIIPIFFPTVWQGPVLWGLYLIGIVLAVLLAKILRGTLLKSEATPFIMELPPYHVPTFRTVGTHTLERGWLYLRKAGTIILAISIVMWALTTFPKERSYAERIGSALEPVMAPMGFDENIGTALIGAFAAKEVFVAQMGIACRVEDADENSVPLREQIREKYSPLTGFCIMLFCLIGTPCMATVAVMARESSWKWAIGQWVALTLLAWIVTTLVYQIGVRIC
ncbi:MAG: ferrous iron transport protein B [Planctomycetia bacterium]|nr:ferrous iron transport protein B [Planctomycetia bacterium]